MLRIELQLFILIEDNVVDLSDRGSLEQRNILFVTNHKPKLELKRLFSLYFCYQISFLFDVWSLTSFLFMMFPSSLAPSQMINRKKNPKTNKQRHIYLFKHSQATGLKMINNVSIYSLVLFCFIIFCDYLKLANDSSFHPSIYFWHPLIPELRVTGVCWSLSQLFLAESNLWAINKQMCKEMCP